LICFRQPIFGVGAKGAEVREAETGNFAASHDEITLLSMGLWNCWVIDFVYYTTDIVSGKQVQFILLCFAFWFLTINHAAMRTAIPFCVFLVFVECAIS
jgi:hypothetical protein